MTRISLCVLLTTFAARVLLIFLLLVLVGPSSALAETWKETSKIVPASIDASDLLGTSVSLAGDVAVVGAPMAGFVGRAFVLERHAGGANNWGVVKTLQASDASSGDRFGESVAIAGDWVMVGAPGADFGSSNNNKGAVYFFQRDEGGVDNWGETQKRFPAGLGTNTYFGSAVDMNAGRAVVGAKAYDDMQDGSGAAYVLALNANGDWEEVKRLQHEAGKSFGYSVAIHGDAVVVGDPSALSGFVISGAAFVFHEDQGGTQKWGFVKLLKPLSPKTADSFGVSVAMDGDGAIVGSPGYDGIGGNIGAAYLYRRGIFWTLEKRIVVPSTHGSAQWAYRVALSGDRAVLGSYDAYHSPTHLKHTGKAAVFERDFGGPKAWGHVQKLTASDAEEDDFFGVVALSGDVLLVGAAGEDASGDAAGATYAFMVTDSDGEACSVGSTCASGYCIDGVCCASLCGGGAVDDCYACSVVAGANADGECSPTSNNPCDDDDACTQTDHCQAGTCVGVDPIQCVAQDQCHDPGTCDPLTGQCDNPAKSDGSVCDDGDACTQTDVCASGSCLGASEVMCAASDECHDVGSCDVATGICSNPAKPDGSPCTGGSCQDGLCELFPDGEGVGGDMTNGAGGGIGGGTGGGTGEGTGGGVIVADGGASGSERAEKFDVAVSCGCWLPGSGPASPNAPWYLLFSLFAARRGFVGGVRRARADVGG